MSAQLSSKAREAFNYYDRNCDGAVSYGELASTAHALGKLFTEDELKKAISEVGKTVTDQFTSEDVAKIFENSLKRDIASSADVVIEAFRVFDKGGDGFVSISELRHALTTLGNALSEEEATNLLADSDLNNDGKIQYESFVKNMISQYKL